MTHLCVTNDVETVLLGVKSDAVFVFWVALLANVQASLEDNGPLGWSSTGTFLLCVIILESSRPHHAFFAQNEVLLLHLFQTLKTGRKHVVVTLKFLFSNKTIHPVRYFYKKTKKRISRNQQKHIGVNKSFTTSRSSNTLFSFLCDTEEFSSLLFVNGRKKNITQLPI